MERTFGYFFESLTTFHKIEEDTKESWRHLSRLSSRALLFEKFLQDARYSSSNIPESTVMDTLINLEKVFRDLQKIIDEVLNRSSIIGFTESKNFQDHIADAAQVNARLSSFAEALEIVGDEILAQFRSEDLEDVLQSFKYAVMETLRELSIRASDTSTKHYSIADDLQQLQRDLESLPDAVVKLLSTRKFRALSIHEMKSIKSEVQRLLLIVNEKGAEMEYSRKQSEIQSSDSSLVASQEDPVDGMEDTNVSSYQVEDISKHFIQRYHFHALNKKDLIRKKEYIDQQRVLYDDVTVTDTVIASWTMGETVKGTFEQKEVAIKTMNPPSKQKALTENKFRLLEGELLTLMYLNKGNSGTEASRLFVNCYGAIVKGSSTIQLVMEMPPFGSLEDMLYDERMFTTFPLALQFAWICDLAEAIEFLYRKDIIHGNVQAKNLFVFEKMKVKLGNFHVYRPTLKKNKGASTLSSRSEEDYLVEETMSLPFLPPEARESRDIDISFDIYSLGITVIQILSRQIPQLEIEPRQQLLEAFETTGLQTLEVKNRLLPVLNDCFKDGNKKVLPKTLRPTGERLRKEMHLALKALGEDPRMTTNGSHRTYMGNLEAMAWQKRKEKEKQRRYDEIPLSAKFSANESTISSISHDDLETTPTSAVDLQPHAMTITPITTPPPSLAAAPLIVNSQSRDSIEENYNSPTPCEKTPSLSMRSRSQSSTEFSPASSMDEENIAVLTNYLRDNVHCTASMAMRIAKILVRNGVLDSEILKRRLNRNAELLFQLGIEETLAEDIYEVVLNRPFASTAGRINRSSSHSWASKTPSPVSPTMRQYGEYPGGSRTSSRLSMGSHSQRLSQRLPTTSTINNRLSMRSLPVTPRGHSYDLEQIEEEEEEMSEGLYPDRYHQSVSMPRRNSGLSPRALSMRSEARTPSNRQSMNRRSIFSLSSVNFDANNNLRASVPTGAGPVSAMSTGNNKLDYCHQEQNAARIASLYHDASQCHDIQALKQLEEFVAKGDIIAEGFMMRMYAIGQIGVKKDVEKAKLLAKKIYPFLQMMAETGSELRSIYACYHIGVCHSEGLGVAQDHRVAAEWYQESAERGYAGAQAYLGFCYYMGVGVAKNYSEAVRWYRIAADQGFCGAQANLGICYEHGHGVEKNPSLAVKYYRLSAEQGASSAQYNLGNCYERGEGIEQNFYESAKWYLQSCQQGYTLAEYALGCFYLDGKGVSVDLARGMELLQAAVNKNYIPAIVRLGECYQEGKGINKNLIRAFKCFERGAETKHAAACYHVGYYYFYGITVERDLSLAAEYYQMGADGGHPMAQLHVAVCYLNGYGLRRDIKKAFEWLQRSAGSGLAMGQFHLGDYYEKYERDQTLAMKYYEMASQQGNVEAKKAIQRMTGYTPSAFGSSDTFTEIEFPSSSLEEEEISLLSSLDH